MTPEILGQLIQAGLPPIVAVALVLVFRAKPDAATVTKEDPAVKLVAELRAIADRQIRIEAMLERILDK